MAQSSKTRSDLYLKISLKLNKSEVNDLRNYVEGRDLLPARDLEKMDPMKMFIELEKKRKLGAGKLELLDELMTSIGRLDLAEEVNKAAEEKERNGSDTVGRNEDASETHRTERDAGDDSGENCDSSLDESLQTGKSLHSLHRYFIPLCTFH
ncbi:Hypp5754 [Branchiostoma lanceolatum]|uniref:Hypp5754 protein n=1 Tax=Branchiostoma lanceolatum TaxID=7740 RepID=A0A8J9W7C6_BRALA|nr:Hypp5754 [Branchiostoma lanceolatum]